MRILQGKGVWAWTEGEVPRAVEMAQAIGARVVLFKTGQEGFYLQDAARRARRRIVDAGLIPVAWPVVTCHNPEAEADVAIQTILDGYAGLVFDIEGPASGQHSGAARLGEIMIETELPPEVMFFTSLPNISSNLDIPYNEMARFCKGGFMPQAYASFGWNPQYTLDVATYREFILWASELNYKSPLYPVMGFYRDQQGQVVLTLGEIRSWLEVLARHEPTFVSVFRAGVFPEVAWPLLADFKTHPKGQNPPRDALVQGDWITVQPGETMSKLCLRHSISYRQFWNWNGHLWDAQKKPREPELLEHGWVVRVK
jgi:hypothetical protein